MTDEEYMRLALDEAKIAASLDEVPVGCVVVRRGEIIAKTHNTRETGKCALDHAEITAIRDACRRAGGWRLNDTTLYVSLEPCPMCAGAIVQARIPRAVIGCRNPKAGCAGSVLDLLHQEGFNHQVELTDGVLEEECSSLMKQFFRELRMK